MGLTIEGGPETHAELFGLLTTADYKFRQAIQSSSLALFRQTDDPGIKAGYDIFNATLNAISRFEWEGDLPTVGDDWETDTDGTIFPAPILVAMAHFLDTAQTICLNSYHLSSGNHQQDTAIIHWPNTILWGLAAKRRFFYDLTEIFSGNPVDNPILTNNPTRALQLLVVGRYLLEEQLEKIGRPKEFKIYLPD